MKNQLTLDFSRPPISVDTGKKTERISFSGSSDLKEFLETCAVKQGLSVSELCQRYVIEGLKNDIGTMLLIQANMQKSLEEIMAR